MGLLTRKTDNNPYSKDIDELLDRGEMLLKKKEEGTTYEESMKKIEELIKELGILEGDTEEME